MFPSCLVKSCWISLLEAHLQELEKQIGKYRTSENPSYLFMAGQLPYPTQKKRTPPQKEGLLRETIG